MKKILIIDDTVTVLMSERLLLSGQGYDVETAYNGEEGLSKVENGPPDLILCDMIMPVMDGVQFVETLRNNLATKKIPVIMVTTQGQKEKIRLCFDAGCNDFVTKPVNKSELLTIIRHHLGRKN